MLSILIRMLLVRPEIFRQLFQVKRLLAVASLAAGMTLAGCGHSVDSETKAGPISVTDSIGSKGQLNSLIVAGIAKLSMMRADDSENAGVDWTVTCGGNPVTGSIKNGACGTLAPTHTADGAIAQFTAPSLVPLGTTVTLTASVTNNPAQNSSAILTIISLPISVTFSSQFPMSLAVNGTLLRQALVTNDATDAGVIWTATCGSSACGSFNPTVTASTDSTAYTAPATPPAGGSVTITATSLTDTTKSANATVLITTSASATADTFTVNVLPASFYIENVGQARNFRLAATVTNDTAALGVDWTLSCGASNCGTISPAHAASGSPVTFTSPSAVPPGGTVTVTARSTTNSTAAASSVATIITSAPGAVSLSAATPLPATLTSGSQTVLAATVTPLAGNSGVDWTATCGSPGACGGFSLSPAHTTSGGQITYTAPSTIPPGGLVTITASSSASTPSNSAIAATTILAQPPTLSFQQSPPAVMVAATQAAVSAVVSNDVPPGGVTWTLQCNSSVAGGCGAILPYQTASGGVATYTAPPATASGTTVRINATSTEDPKVSISSTPIAINPDTTRSVSFIPLAPSQVQANATVNLAAAVANDATNAGVDWQVCASGCGFFTIKPAIPAIAATATTPYVPPVPAATTTTVSAWPNNLPLPYTAPTAAPSSGSVVMLIAAHVSPAAALSATVAINSAANGPGLHGVVQAGSQPVVGASVALYAAGTSGYSSAASQIASALPTDKNGSFNLPAGYECPQPGSQMYLVAVGGQVGTNAPNPNLALMTALGSCSNLSSGPIVLNEVTTIASAWATAPFAANDALTGNSSYLYLGTSSGNQSGLANAFAAVNNLADISTGQARFVVPAGNATVPYVEINTLADILNACTASPGGVEGDGSLCGQLFTVTDVLANHSLYNSFAPTDTLQAAFNLAQHPVSNYGYQLGTDPSLLFALATPGAAFQPILTSKPNDWSIALNYTHGGGLSGTSTVGSFAVDAVGNLWITDSKVGMVIEWNGIGAALSPATGFQAGGGPIAIDATGNVWISGNGSLTELTGLGYPVPGSPFGGVPGGGGDVAIDAQSNLWITTGSGVAEFNSLGMEISPADGYTNNALTNVGGAGVDSSNNVWVTNVTPAESDLAELTNPGGELIVNAKGPASVITPAHEIAADGAGDIWAIAGPRVCTVPPYGGRGAVLPPTCYEGDNPLNGGLLYFAPGGIALDGAGIVWVASQGGGSSPVILPSVLPIAPNLLASSISPNYFVSSTLSSGPLRVAVDGSGNVWVLLADNTVTEYVGLATPVVTPIAAGVKNKKLAAKP
jgi:hypothetical protein